MRHHSSLLLALVLVPIALFAGQPAAEAQRAKKTPVIGVVAGASTSPAHPIRGFQQGLRELGYTEGENILVEYRWAHGKPAQFPALVADLVRLNVNAIVAGNTAAAVAAKEATTTIRS